MNFQSDATAHNFYHDRLSSSGFESNQMNRGSSDQKQDNTISSDRKQEPSGGIDPRYRQRLRRTQQKKRCDPLSLPIFVWASGIATAATGRERRQRRMGDGQARLRTRSGAARSRRR
mmetsp:Transcript_33062/g.80346  ORF Transcript_33062/g.80346 Transcript_33062/m.80346 type:complete len:117 (-) Transcript_33062:503-853(-)